MLPYIELSPRALLEVRIKALEHVYRDVYKTIDYANKILLEHELGTAYNELMNHIKIEPNGNKIFEDPSNFIRNKQTGKYCLRSTTYKRKQPNNKPTSSKSTIA